MKRKTSASDLEIDLASNREEELFTEELKGRYRNVTNLLAQSKAPHELSVRLREFKNVDPVTARIFLQEMHPHWRSSRAAAGE